MMLLKSRLYREQAFRWILVLAFAGWAITATAWAISKKSETLLIAIEPSGARVISDRQDMALKAESVEFLKAFLALYFNFDETSHRDQIGKAADLMSSALWEREQPKLLEIDKKLKAQPLTQVAEIESIDQTGENRFEAILSITVRSRMSESKGRVKASIRLAERARTRENPWRFEIEEFKDEIL